MGTISEYRQVKSHSNRNKEAYQGDSQMVTHQFLCKHKNKDVKVPEQSDLKEEKEFESRLKEIYLRKIESGFIKEKEPVLSSSFIKNEEEQCND